MDDGSVDPKGDELATLLSALKPQAIEVLIRALPTMTRVDAREQLGATLDRLASMNPGLMAEFIRSEDPRVAAETARIAARLKMVDVSDAIASLLDRPSSEVRLAAVESLVALRSSKAGNPLVKALRDEGRDVRIAAARGLAELKYGPAAQDLESLVRSKDLLRRDLTEQLADFEAYAVAAGEKGTKLLARLLNGRRFFWIKYPSRMRACAARALGLVGGEEARAALSIAERSRDPMVLSAVHATRRRPDTETDDAER
jgi:HEAT repeat protein